MSSKATYIFLAVYFIAMIDSGFSIKCYQNCTPQTDPGDCNVYKMEVNCPEYCSTEKVASGPLHGCLRVGGLDGCQKNPQICKACFTDGCNDFTDTSGTSVKCWQDCQPPEDDCQVYKKLVNCPEYCVTSNDTGSPYHMCLADGTYEKCKNDTANCKACNSDKCNDFFTPGKPY